MHRICLFLATLLIPISAINAEVSLGGDTATTAKLISEESAIAPGKPFTLALQLEQPAGWHSYYKNTGGVEMPPKIDWKLPDGFTAGPIQWPVPTVKEGFSGKSFVYLGSPVFLVEITAPPSLAVGQAIPLTADASWQICEEGCKNETKSFTLTLPVAVTPAKDAAQASLFTVARSGLATKIPALKTTATSTGAEVQLRLTPAAAIQGTPTDFVPDQPFIQAASAGGSIKQDGDAWLIRLKYATKDAFDKAIPPGKSFSGILTGPTAVEIPDTTLSSPPAESLPFSKYLPILGGMLLGGLILNLMPCVFPVIGLKIMGFVQQSGSELKKIVLHGVMFTVGVLASFGVLSGILFAARSAAGAGGSTIGWGYQLQNPWVVMVLMLMMFTLALNMCGLFELGTSATSVGGNL